MSSVNHCTFERILIAVDDSPAAGWALQVGAELAKRLGAKVLLVNVIEQTVVVGHDFIGAQQVEAVRRQHSKALLAKLSLKLAPAIRADSTMCSGNAAEEILAVAKQWRPDLIVLGSRGRGMFGKMLLGSTSEHVTRHAECPVVTVPHDPIAKQPAAEAHEATTDASSTAASASHN